MKAIEFYLNGRLLATAGAGDGHLSAVVSRDKLDEDAFGLHLGGIDGASGEFLRWTLPAARAGDEVTIRIVEADRVDPPNSRRPPPDWTPEMTIGEIKARIDASRRAAGE